MSVDQETKPMRRLPDSSPRIPKRLRFPILFFVGIDFALAGLLLVIWFTPLNPNYPVGTPMKPDNRPHTIETIVLSPPMPTPPHSAPVAPVHTAPVHRVTPTPPRPSATRTAAPTPTATTTTRPPRPTTTPTPTNTNTTQPTDTGSPTS